MGGIAEFTRLRVDRNAVRLILFFTTEPARFESESSVQFDVVPLPDTTAKERVSFLVQWVGLGDGSDGVEWGSVEVRSDIVRQIGEVLDVDISRIQNLTLVELVRKRNVLLTVIHT